MSMLSGKVMCGCVEVLLCGINFFSLEFPHKSIILYFSVICLHGCVFFGPAASGCMRSCFDYPSGAGANKPSTCM